MRTQRIVVLKLIELGQIDQSYLAQYIPVEYNFIVN